MFRFIICFSPGVLIKSLCLKLLQFWRMVWSDHFVWCFRKGLRGRKHNFALLLITSHLAHGHAIWLSRLLNKPPSYLFLFARRVIFELDEKENYQENRQDQLAREKHFYPGVDLYVAIEHCGHSGPPSTIWEPELFSTWLHLQALACGVLIIRASHIPASRYASLIHMAYCCSCNVAIRHF